VGFAALIQFALILLDVAGLLLIGGIVAIVTSAVQGSELPQALNFLTKLLNLSQSTPQFTAAVLGLIAASLLILKSFLSYYFGLRNYAFLARREARISESLAQRIFSLKVTELNSFSTPQYQHALTIGSSSVMGGVIGQTLSLMTELVLQITMLATLFFFSPLLTLVCLVLFSALFLILSTFQGERARKWGAGMTRADVTSTSLVSDAIGSYREIYVSNRRSFYIDRIRKSREEAASFQVNKSMLTQFSKYIFEISVVFFGLGVSAYAFLTKPAIEAASLVAIFVTAATRIAPSVLKLQQGILQLRGAAGATELFFEVDSFLTLCGKKVTQSDALIQKDIELSLGIVLKNISFTYPKRSSPALKDVSLEIPHRSSYAFVGPSGAGKSTLVDIILDVISPDQGEVRVFGVNHHAVQAQFPGRIAYVPQNVYLTSGSILDNIALGVDPDSMDEALAWDVLKRVHLDSWVKELPKGIHSSAGERGSQMSGGQKQRLGIARALYQDPLLLILDEATSSLDAESEFEISKAVESLADTVTLIIIAHRLSTVQHCDQVVYLKEGKVLSQGTFDELRDSVPDFDRQANLMGLKR
jgi:ATP-binding cassette subfamily C protein